MTDIKEAQGLEVVAWLNTSSSEATTYTPTVMDWDDEHEPVESLIRLSSATAVIDQLREQIAALKSAPVVMPERSTDTDWLRSNDEYNEGWNDCLDEVARLNRSKT